MNSLSDPKRKRHLYDLTSMQGMQLADMQSIRSAIPDYLKDSTRVRANLIDGATKLLSMRKVVCLTSHNRQSYL